MTRILGTDISAYQGTVDFTKMEDAGAKFVIMRKSLGYYGDLKFWENFESAKKTGLKIGAYGVPFVGYDINRQFTKFIEGLSPVDLDFPPFPDIERRHRYTKSRAISDMLSYMLKLKDWWGDAVVYTAKFVWEEKYSSKPGWIDSWDLFLANYTTANEPHYVPHGWEERLSGAPVEVTDSYALWQFSADRNRRGAEFGVSSRDIDLDLMKQWFWDKHISPGIPPINKEEVVISYNPHKVKVVLNEM